MAANGAPADAAVPVSLDNGEIRQERPARGERGEGRRELGERGEGRRERGERAEGQNGGGVRAAEGADQVSRPAAPMIAGAPEMAATADLEAGATDSAVKTDRPEGEERRERRSRDRYGRDRRERNGERAGERERAPKDDATEQESAMDRAEVREPVARSYFDRPSTTATTEASAPAEARADAKPDHALVATSTDGPRPAPAPAVAVAVAVAAIVPAMPAVTRFTLPMDELAQIAERSGLQWVNSDAGKVAAAQAAIAAEPAPIHVPRERPPLALPDEGPLVLVETRKDLRNLNLPF